MHTTLMYYHIELLSRKCIQVTYFYREFVYRRGVGQIWRGVFPKEKWLCSKLWQVILYAIHICDQRRIYHLRQESVHRNREKDNSCLLCAEVIDMVGDAWVFYCRLCFLSFTQDFHYVYQSIVCSLIAVWERGAEEREVLYMSYSLCVCCTKRCGRSLIGILAIQGLMYTCVKGWHRNKMDIRAILHQEGRLDCIQHVPCVRV